MTEPPSRCVRIEVHGEFFTALNRVDELAVPRTEIQDRCVQRHVLCEPIADERLPHLFPISEVIAKPRTVDPLQVLRGMSSHCERSTRVVNMDVKPIITQDQSARVH